MPTAIFNIYDDATTGNMSSYVDAAGLPEVRLLGRANFSTALPPPIVVPGYVFAATDSNPFIEAGALRMNYPALAASTGGIFNALHFDVPNGHKELFIKFDAKMPNAKHGLKFFKVFGRNATGGENTVANATFGLDYTGINNGSMIYVNFGDGTTNSNDAQQVVNLSGASPANVGRSWGMGASIVSPGVSFLSSQWGTGWHTFRFKIKFNDGTSAANEVNNGEIWVSIDGVDYVKATGLFNRHYTNGDIAYLSFGDWSQAPAGGSPAFDIHFDNIFVSQYGFYEGV